MAEVKRNERDPLPAHKEGSAGIVVMKYETKDIPVGSKDWRCAPVKVRVLKGVQVKKDVHGNVDFASPIKWTITPHKSCIVQKGEIYELTNRRTIDQIVTNGLGEIVTEENTKKADKASKK